MDELHFEWEQNKNITNQEKYNVSFEEAQTVFGDEYALLISDLDYLDEARLILLGFSFRAELLVVCHYYGQSANMIRLISARKATKEETTLYRFFAKFWELKDKD